MIFKISNCIAISKTHDCSILINFHSTVKKVDRISRNNVVQNLQLYYNTFKIFRPPPVVGGFIAMQQWVKARMWFNMLGAQYHESITHLGRLFKHDCIYTLYTQMLQTFVT